MARAQIFIFDIIIATTAFILIALIIMSISRPGTNFQREETYIFCLSALESLKANSTISLVANGTKPESLLNISLSQLPKRFGYWLNVSTYPLSTYVPPMLSSEIKSFDEGNGDIGYDEKDFYVAVGSPTSKIGIDKTREITPEDTKYRSYVSFKTESLPENAVILSATIVVYVDSRDIIEADPTWQVEYRIGNGVIGEAVDKEDWNNEKFEYVGSAEYNISEGEVVFEIPEEYLDKISVTTNTDLELIPKWGDEVKEGQRAVVNIRQLKYGSNDPTLKITYTETNASTSVHYYGLSGDLTDAENSGNIISVQSTFVTVNSTPLIGQAQLKCWVRHQ